MEFLKMDEISNEKPVKGVSGKKKYRLVYDRASCIGAAACEAVAPERWKMADDGKADLLNGKTTEPDNFEYWFDEDELDKLVESAQVCPVTVIHIFDEEGNQIV